MQQSLFPACRNGGKMAESITDSCLQVVLHNFLFLILRVSYASETSEKKKKDLLCAANPAI
jgi:hypothetical protein